VLLFRKGFFIIALYVVFAVFVEDVILAVRRSGLNISSFLSLATVASQASLAFVSLLWKGWRPKMNQMRVAFAVSSLLSACSSVLNNNGTLMLNFNTSQLFKTSKIVFVMILGSSFLDHKYSKFSKLCGAALFLGLILLSQADSKGDEKTATNFAFGCFLMFNGMVLIAVNAILIEAVLQRKQVLFFSLEHAIEAEKSAGTLRDELIFFTNLFTMVVLLFGSISSGEFTRGVAFFASSPQRILAQQFSAMAIQAVGQRLVYDLAQSFGSTTATLIVTIRKAITFLISAFIFPKPFTSTHALAITLTSISAFALQRQILIDQKRFRKATPSDSFV